MSLKHALRLYYRAERRPLQIGAVRLTGLRPALAVAWGSAVLWRIASWPAQQAENPSNWILLIIGTFLGVFIVSGLSTLRGLGSQPERALLILPLCPKERISLFLLQRLISIRFPLYGFLLLLGSLLFEWGLNGWLRSICLLGTAASALCLGVFSGLICVLRPGLTIVSGVAAAALLALIWAGDHRNIYVSVLVAFLGWGSALAMLISRETGGRLLVAAIESQTRLRSRWKDPVLFSRVADSLLKIRHPVGAFLFRQWQSRKRLGLTWARWCQTVFFLVAFPWLEPLLSQLFDSWLDRPALLFAYLNLVFLLAVVDGSIAPFAGDGSRALAWITAPISHSQLLRARWLCHALPLALGAGLAGLALGLWSGFQALTLTKLVLLTAGQQAVASAIVVLLNRRELDLLAPVASGMAAALAETVPFTPIRLLTVALLSSFLGAAIFVVKWSQLLGAAP